MPNYLSLDVYPFYLKMLNFSNRTKAFRHTQLPLTLSPLIHVGKALIEGNGYSLVKINKDNVLLYCPLTPHPCGATRYICFLAPFRIFIALSLLRCVNLQGTSRCIISINIYDFNFIWTTLRNDMVLLSKVLYYSVPKIY